MAHAVHGYAGKCSNVHGHSYHLEITVASAADDYYIPAPGFIIDFKEIKKVVQSAVIDQLDHMLVLSEDFLQANNAFASLPNLSVWPYEPTAENILLHIKEKLEHKLPAHVHLCKVKLYETADSFAEWLLP